jgi:hypothetical protein
MFENVTFFDHMHSTFTKSMNKVQKTNYNIFDNGVSENLGYYADSNFFYMGSKNVSKKVWQKIFVKSAKSEKTQN